MTPIISPLKNLRIKLEHMGPAGSHKARSARYIIRKAIAEGHIFPGGSRRIIEKSGGNFGIGLAYEAAKYNIGVDLVIGLSFSPIKRRLCEEFGARLVGTDLLHQGLQPKEVITSYIEHNNNKYFYTDQFSNKGNIEAHIEETGPEIINDIKNDINKYSGIILVFGAGTGAHASAIHSVISNFCKKIELIIIEPENCSFNDNVYGTHAQQGVAVGARPPFLDFSKVNRFVQIRDVEAKEGQRLMARECGIYPGLTSGANFFLARRLAKEMPERLVITMTYDTGDSYLYNTGQDYVQ